MVNNYYNSIFFSSSKPEQCEVSSSVGPYLSTLEGPSTSSWHSISPSIIDWEVPRSYQDSSDIWTMSGLNGGGVIVEPIKTFHMGVAMATKQIPFALLKPDHGVPVLVKVVDTKLPGGKQVRESLKHISNIIIFQRVYAELCCCYQACI